MREQIFLWGATHSFELHLITNMTFYNKHLLDIKNSSVCETEEELSCAYNAIPWFVCGDGNCGCYPQRRPDSFNSRGGRGFFKSKSVGNRDDYSIQ